MHFVVCKVVAGQLRTGQYITIYIYISFKILKYKLFMHRVSRLCQNMPYINNDYLLTSELVVFGWKFEYIYIHIYICKKQKKWAPAKRALFSSRAKGLVLEHH